MDQKSHGTLEYPKILDRLAALTSFSAGAELARALEPTADLAAARRRQAETTEARRLISASADVSLGGAHDVRPQTAQAERGVLLLPQDLLDIRDTLLAARSVRRSLTRMRSDYPLLAETADRLEDGGAVVAEVSRTLNDKGEVLDAASPRLAQIRQELRTAQDRLQDKLRSIVNSSTNGPYLQDAIITQRGGRYVIPIKSEFKGRIPGVVHDQSASGATLFIEPLSTVELNNQVRELELAEEEEVRRILAALTALVGAEAEHIRATVQALAELDLALAKAEYAYRLRATEPELVPFRTVRESREPQESPSHPGSTIKLFSARHPLLDPARVVPIDVVLDEETYQVIITGPNTGGKTVALKTVGLLVLMAQAGLHIPATEGSALSVFSEVFADIGDEQSIEQSLSTFSAHMTNTVRILQQASAYALVILDELGAGTDPGEGAALARAILLYLLEQRVTTLVATHYPELKIYAYTTSGVRNASVEFDIETLAPTYRLAIGLPGRSNALAIASRLGLPAEIVERARSLVGASDLKAEDLLAELHRSRNEAEAEMDRLIAQRTEAEHSQAELSQRLMNIDAERRAILQAAREEARAELESLRSEVRELRRRLQAAGLPLDALRGVEADSEDLIAETSEPIEPNWTVREARRERGFRLGDMVWVPSIRAMGQITALDGGDAEIQLGRIRIRARLDELTERPPVEAETQTPAGDGRLTARQRRLKGAGERAVTTESALAPARSSPGIELDLRGRTVEEALAQLDRYLDAAFLAGLPWVRIIHGKGTGALRQAVRQELAHHSLVQDYQAGKDSEGGDGVTVARLRYE